MTDAGAARIARLGPLGYAVALSVAASLLSLALILSIGLGAARLEAAEVVRALLDPAAVEPNVAQIVRELRLPRALLGALVGASLAVSGAGLQAVMRSNLADPYVLGVSSGASIGAALAVVTGAEHVLGGAGLMGLAYGSALLGVLVVWLLARVGGQVRATRLLLAGAAFSAFAGAITGLLLFLVPEASALRGLVFWLLGGLGAADWGLVRWTAGSTVVGVLALWALARAQNLLLLGDEVALSLGLDVVRARAAIVVAAALLTGGSVAAAGAIGFVGLVVPHMLRPWTGPDHRRLVPAAAVVGALFVVVLDVVARLALAPRELPVGILTGLLGAPVFLLLLRRAGGEGDGRA